MVLWNHIRRVFWINYSRPHRKLVIQYREGGIKVPYHQRHINNSKRNISNCIHAKTDRKLLIDPKLVTSRFNLISTKLPPPRVSADVTFYRQVRQLQTTARRQIPPVLWAVLKPLGKVWAMLWGR